MQTGEPTLRPKSTRLSYREKTDLETLPDKIADLEARIAELETSLSDPTFVQKDRSPSRNRNKEQEQNRGEDQA